MNFITNIVVLCVLPVLSIAQFSRRNDRVFINGNLSPPYEARANQEFVIESDNLRSVDRGYGNERRGQQYELYPENNNRNIFVNRRTANDDNFGQSSTRFNENSQAVKTQRQFNGRLTKLDRDSDIVSRRNREDSSVNYNNQASATNLHVYTNQPTTRTINDKPDQHNIVFIDNDNENRRTTKPDVNHNNNNKNKNTKTTQENEIHFSKSTPGTDGSWTLSTSGATSVTPSTPAVDDRAAFVGEKCPNDTVRFNGICVDVDR